MKPAPFGYRRARSVADAVALLAELGPEAKVLAGGQSLVPMMAFRLARPGTLVDVTGVPGLAGITLDDEGLTVGALTTHHDVETCTVPGVREAFPVVLDAMDWIGHLPIRTLGTVGGSIAHGDALAEWCLLAVLLDARIRAEGPAGVREIAAGEFFQGFYTTALAPDELVTAVRFPGRAPRSAIAETAPRRGDYAVVSAAVSLDGAAGARIALGGVADVPVRVPEAEQEVATALAGGLPQGWAERAGRVASAAVDPPTDTRGTGGYRRELVATLVARALRQAQDRA